MPPAAVYHHVLMPSQAVAVATSANTAPAHAFAISLPTSNPPSVQDKEKARARRRPFANSVSRALPSCWFQLRILSLRLMPNFGPELLNDIYWLLHIFSSYFSAPAAWDLSDAIVAHLNATTWSALAMPNSTQVDEPPMQLPSGTLFGASC
ncbi:hypothetical protein CDD83_10223 [Cordyceps sp. RAO-2017]|nr:hypothetical protein CDD83_10223 [Cordyceps sp. RAO-2017]